MLAIHFNGKVLRRGINAVAARLKNAADPAVQEVGDGVCLYDVAIALETIHHAGGIHRAFHGLDRCSVIEEIPFVDDQLEGRIGRAAAEQTGHVPIVRFKLASTGHHGVAWVGILRILSDRRVIVDCEKLNVLSGDAGNRGVPGVATVEDPLTHSDELQCGIDSTHSPGILHSALCVGFRRDVTAYPTAKDFVPKLPLPDPVGCRVSVAGAHGSVL